MSKSVDPDRRGFLKGSILAGAASVAAPSLAQAAEPPAAPEAKPAPTPSHERAQAEAGHIDVQAPSDGQHVVNPGSDFMVDLMKAASIDYVALMPGSTFRGLHESIVNYGGNKKPQLITCVHEEVSAAICHGYAKVAGKPMACIVHSNVGLQHASMAIYNCYADKVPMMVLAGNGLDAVSRRPGVEWLHSGADLGSMVRDFVKWDDIPASLQHYSESFMRAHEMAMTPPYEPVLLIVDLDLQENPIPDRGKLSIPKRAPVSPPGPDPAAMEELTTLLAEAKSPVIVADRMARTPEGMAQLVVLAELLNAPVIDQACRMNMPTNHYLNHTFRQKAAVDGADVVLALELTDLWGLLYSYYDRPERTSRKHVPDATKVIAVSAKYAFMKGNIQDIQRYYAADLTLASDAQSCMPQIIDGVRRKLSDAQKRSNAEKTPALKAQFDAMRAAAAEEAALSWDASPIGTGRLCMELWDQIKGENWALVSNPYVPNSWPMRLWDATEHHQFIGGEGAFGVGYTAPASIGAAIAHREAGRLPISLQSDGDLLVLPGSLWTLAHHEIPLLMVMHNNRAWHQESMHLQRMANRRNRDPTTWTVGTVLTNPDIDFAGMARSMGVWAEGPITDPAHLKPALARALAVVKSGKPALLDVVTQPR